MVNVYWLFISVFHCSIHAIYTSDNSEVISHKRLHCSTQVQHHIYKCTLQVKASPKGDAKIEMHLKTSRLVIYLRCLKFVISLFSFGFVFSFRPYTYVKMSRKKRYTKYRARLDASSYLMPSIHQISCKLTSSCH